MCVGCTLSPQAGAQIAVGMVSHRTWYRRVHRIIRCRYPPQLPHSRAADCQPGGNETCVQWAHPLYLIVAAIFALQNVFHIDMSAVVRSYAAVRACLQCGACVRVRACVCVCVCACE